MAVELLMAMGAVVGGIALFIVSLLIGIPIVERVDAKVIARHQEALLRRDRAVARLLAGDLDLRD